MSIARIIRKETDSPCIGTCSTVRGDKVCVGCLRSFDEILNWTNLTDKEKITINQRVEKVKLNS